jgi:hypothetical protein
MRLIKYNVFGDTFQTYAPTIGEYHPSSKVNVEQVPDKMS